MRLPLAAALLLSVSLLAGCAGPEASVAPAPEPVRTGEGPEPEPMTQTADFGWAAATGTPGSDVQFMTSNGDLREVGKEAASLVADIAWDCGSPSCNLHAYLCAPDEVGASPVGPACAIHAMGPSPLQLTAEDPVAGEWLVHLASDGPTADVVGTITMTETCSCATVPTESP